MFTVPVDFSLKVWDGLFQLKHGKAQFFQLKHGKSERGLMREVKLY